jgi:hypothetical protein
MSNSIMHNSVIPGSVAATSRPANVPKILGHPDTVNGIIRYYIKNINNIEKPAIDQIAKFLMDLGRARDFVHGVWKKRYYGNPGLCKTLTLSYGCA